MFYSKVKSVFCKCIGQVVSLTCISILIWIIYVCIDNYLQYNTTLMVKRTKISEVDFPDFTVCPYARKGYRSDVMKKLDVDFNYKDKMFENDGRTHLNWDIFDKITFAPYQFIERVELKGDSFELTIDSSSDEFKNMSKIVVEERYGKCASISIPKEYAKKSLYGIVIISQESGMNIFVHHSGHYYLQSYPKVAAKINKPLWVDTKFNMLYDISGEECESYMNGNLAYILTDLLSIFSLLIFFQGDLMNASSMKLDLY